MRPAIIAVILILVLFFRLESGEKPKVLQEEESSEEEPETEEKRGEYRQQTFCTGCFVTTPINYSTSFLYEVES